MALPSYIIWSWMHIVSLTEKFFVYNIKCNLNILNILNFFAMAIACCKNEWMNALTIDSLKHYRR